MKRFAILFALLFLTTAAFAQQKFQTKMIEIHHRVPRDIYTAVRTLGSGSGGADLSFDNEMHTITVRDFPENIAAIEEAIARLDKPAAAAPGVQLKISILIGSKSVLPGPEVSEELAPVVKQLTSTLRYSHYGLMAAIVQRTRAGEGIDGSGVAEPALVGMAASDEHPVFYNYQLRNIRVEPSSTVDMENFSFNMKVPVKLEKGTTYESVGFRTPVSIRENEKVVIGTTTIRDRAVIVVVTATVLSGM